MNARVGDAIGDAADEDDQPPEDQEMESEIALKV